MRPVRIHIQHRRAERCLDRFGGPLADVIADELKSSSSAAAPRAASNMGWLLADETAPVLVTAVAVGCLSPER